MKIHHIGYLVRKIEKAQIQFMELGYLPISNITYDKYRDVDIIFMEKDGYIIELVSPKSEKSVVAKLIRVYKNSPYHICYETENFEQEISHLEETGFIKIDNPCPAPALQERRVCFLQNASIGMIEVLEKSF